MVDPSRIARDIVALVAGIVGIGLVLTGHQGLGALVLVGCLALLAAE